MNYSFKPIITWPGAHTKARRVAPFRSNYLQTLDLLERELCAINAQAVTIQLALRETEIRNDGRPRADSKPAHPGVIVSFSRGKVPYSFPCDTFWDWQDNLRGIALSLEALRKVDRYGVTTGHQQYAGFRQLPGPLVMPAGMTLAAAALWLANVYAPGLKDAHAAIVRQPEIFRQAYRDMSKRLHPDAGGAPAEWAKLQAAADVLKRHHGI